MQSLKRIAIFLRTPKFAGHWAVGGEGVPLSGTDATLLFLVRALEASGRFQAVLVGQAPPAESGFEFHAARSLCEAHAAAKGSGASHLVFNTAGIEELGDMRSAPPGGPELVLWAQNSPGFDWLCAASNLPQAFWIVAVSDWQRYGFSSHPIYPRTVSIPNPAPDKSFWLDPATRRPGALYQVCYVGALKESKGFHHLARVWPAFRAKHPEVGLIVCGSSSLYDPGASCGAAGLTDDGYERQILQLLGGSLESARDLGVVFRGSLPHEELRQVVSESAFVVVNPNLRGSTETFCCSAVEAQCFGVPVIGARAGALRETVGHGLGGLLFRDDAEFLQHMLWLAEDEGLRNKLARQGFGHVTGSYCREKIVARWFDFFDGRKIGPFAGDIRHWATFADHTKRVQRLLPTELSRSLRRFKARLRGNK